MVGKKSRQTLEFHGNGLLDRTRYPFAPSDPADIRGVHVHFEGDPAKQPTAQGVRPGSAQLSLVLIQLHPPAIVGLCHLEYCVKSLIKITNRALVTIKQRAPVFLF